MNRTIQILCLALSILGSSAASAAIFDSLDSVDTLKVIAAKQADKTDRMPAGKVTDPAKDDATAVKSDTTGATDAEKKK